MKISRQNHNFLKNVFEENSSLVGDMSASTIKKFLEHPTFAQYEHDGNEHPIVEAIRREEPDYPKISARIHRGDDADWTNYNYTNSYEHYSESNPKKSKAHFYEERVMPELEKKHHLYKTKFDDNTITKIVKHHLNKMFNDYDVPYYRVPELSSEHLHDLIDHTTHQSIQLNAKNISTPTLENVPATIQTALFNARKESITPEIIKKTANLDKHLGSSDRLGDNAMTGITLHPALSKESHHELLDHLLENTDDEHEKNVTLTNYVFHKYLNHRLATARKKVDEHVGSSPILRKKLDDAHDKIVKVRNTFVYNYTPLPQHHNSTDEFNHEHVQRIVDHIASQFKGEVDPNSVEHLFALPGQKKRMNINTRETLIQLHSINDPKIVTDEHREKIKSLFRNHAPDYVHRLVNLED